MYERATQLYSKQIMYDGTFDLYIIEKNVIPINGDRPLKRVTDTPVSLLEVHRRAKEYDPRDYVVEIRKVS